ncbi:hypothetical protein DFH27DRAFT_613339 [Peziza echinospora]|nr:hypothetical protein DFH27DRAFT_613339 [Peziza echinospora]
MPSRVSNITAAKTRLGFGEGSSGKYRAWRCAVKANAEVNGGVSNWSHPGFEALVTFAVANANFPVLGRMLYTAETTEFPIGGEKQMVVNKAVRELVADCLKKTKETARARQRANEDDDDNETMPVGPAKRRRTAAIANVMPAGNWTVQFFLCDPDGYLHPSEVALPPVVPPPSSPLPPPEELRINFTQNSGTTGVLGHSKGEAAQRGGAFEAFDKNRPTASVSRRIYDTFQTLSPSTCTMTGRIVTRNPPSEIPPQTSPNTTLRQNVISPQPPRIRKRPSQVFESHDDGAQIPPAPYLQQSAKRRVASGGTISSNALRTLLRVPLQSRHLNIPTLSPPASGDFSPLGRRVSKIHLTADGFNDDSDGERTIKVVRESWSDQPAEGHLERVLSRTQSLSVFTFKTIALELLKFKDLPVEEVKKRVEYLLEDHRFLFPEDKREFREGPFLAGEIVEFIFHRFFHGPKSTHACMTATWALYPTRVSTLLIGFIKNKLNTLVVKEYVVADEDPVAPAALHSGDHKDLEKYLELQLQEQIDQHKSRMHRNRRIVHGLIASQGEDTQLQQTIAADMREVADLPSQA